MSCKYCDGSGIPYGDKTQEFCVFENHGHPEIVIPVGSNASVSAHIDICPKCGRNLKTADNEFEYSIKIPVPIGERVWTFWTTCCNACSFQPRKDHPLSCSRGAPCHTLKHAIQSKELTYDNLKEIIDGWGVYYFKTSKEAEAAGNKRIEENIKKMRELGYQIDDEGYALKQKGWDTIDE
jgi:hypothetical protein